MGRTAGSRPSCTWPATRRPPTTRCGTCAAAAGLENGRCAVDRRCHPGGVMLGSRRLLAHWADLPTLAWLAANRFGGAVVRVPVFGPLCAAIGWLSTLVVLAGARADRACAAHGRKAVLTVRQRWPRRSRRIRNAVFLAALPVGAIMLAAPPAAAIVAGAVAETAGWRLAARVLLIGAPAMFVLLAAAAVAGTASGLRGGARRATGPGATTSAWWRRRCLSPPTTAGPRPCWSGNCSPTQTGAASRSWHVPRPAGRQDVPDTRTPNGRRRTGPDADTTATPRPRLRMSPTPTGSFVTSAPGTARRASRPRRSLPLPPPRRGDGSRRRGRTKRPGQRPRRRAAGVPRPLQAGDVYPPAARVVAVRRGHLVDGERLDAGTAWFFPGLHGRSPSLEAVRRPSGSTVFVCTDRFRGCRARAVGPARTAFHRFGGCASRSATAGTACSRPPTADRPAAP